MSGQNPQRPAQHPCESWAEITVTLVLGGKTDSSWELTARFSERLVSKNKIDGNRRQTWFFAPTCTHEYVFPPDRQAQREQILKTKIANSEDWSLRTYCSTFQRNTEIHELLLASMCQFELNKFVGIKQVCYVFSK